MGLGTSILLVAIGAIMKFALNLESGTVEIDTVGTILMIVGAVGAVLSMAFWSSWGGAGMGSRSRRTTAVYDDGAAPQPVAPDGGARRVVREEVRDDRL